jgi:hypothetical protein
MKPLLKKPTPDRNTLSNYRPVSNLPYLSKLIEKAVFAQLTEHLTVQVQPTSRPSIRIQDQILDRDGTPFSIR